MELVFGKNRSIPYPVVYKCKNGKPVTQAPRRVFWHGRQDLNPQPPDLESGALPVEPLPY